MSSIAAALTVVITFAWSHDSWWLAQRWYVEDRIQEKAAPLTEKLDQLNRSVLRGQRFQLEQERDRTKDGNYKRNIEDQLRQIEVEERGIKK